MIVVFRAKSEVMNLRMRKLESWPGVGLVQPHPQANYVGYIFYKSKPIKFIWNPEDSSDEYNEYVLQSSYKSSLTKLIETGPFMGLWRII